MTDQQFMEEALARFRSLASEKFQKGVREHGGKLWTKPGMLDEIEAEILDIWFYIQALREQLRVFDKSSFSD